MANTTKIEVTTTRTEVTTTTKEASTTTTKEASTTTKKVSTTTRTEAEAEAVEIIRIETTKDKKTSTSQPSNKMQFHLLSSNNRTSRT
jgi:hypothetical protein